MESKLGIEEYDEGHQVFYHYQSALEDDRHDDFRYSSGQYDSAVVQGSYTVAISQQTSLKRLGHPTDGYVYVSLQNGAYNNAFHMDGGVIICVDNSGYGDEVRPRPPWQQLLFQKWQKLCEIYQKPIDSLKLIVLEDIPDPVDLDVMKAIYNRRSLDLTKDTEWEWTAIDEKQCDGFETLIGLGDVYKIFRMLCDHKYALTGHEQPLEIKKIITNHHERYVLFPIGRQEKASNGSLTILQQIHLKYVRNFAVKGSKIYGAHRKALEDDSHEDIVHDSGKYSPPKKIKNWDFSFELAEVMKHLQAPIDSTYSREYIRGAYSRQSIYGAYENLFCLEKGVIVTLQAFASLDNVLPRAPWSQITFKWWRKLCMKHKVPIENFRLLLQDNIVNDKSIIILETIHTIPGLRQDVFAEWYPRTESGEECREFMALVGTDNVKGTVRMLADHKNELAGGSRIPLEVKCIITNPLFRSIAIRIGPVEDKEPLPIRYNKQILPEESSSGTDDSTGGSDSTEGSGSAKDGDSTEEDDAGEDIESTEEDDASEGTESTEDDEMPSRGGKRAREDEPEEEPKKQARTTGTVAGLLGSLIRQTTRLNLST